MYTFKKIKKRGARSAAALLLVIVFALSSCLCYAQTPVFPDVPARHWAYPYVRACARAGII
ncbi:MAG: S-layer homology domain-containing protein, partial [Firmicutes bacterium]|nr:S-layer homology domain-containing protein [Bacillota bacterium]